jgi:cathepsin A (carboxypeptidase C)
MAYENSSTAPILLYLNGGPGCSSMQGLLVEMGPFRILDYGKKVVENKYAWNRFANVLYLDAPAGVGYSINLHKNYTFTDSQVSSDNHEALKAFFNLFPEFKGNDFYIGGESYAGYYIPMLADRLLNDSINFSNFKGYLVGNGCLNDKMLFNSGIEYNYNHGFIDQRFYESSVKKCCNGKSSEGCNWYQFSSTPQNPCFNISLSLNEANYYTGVDPYFLYFSCYLDQPDGINHFNRMPTLGGRNSVQTMKKHLMKRFGKSFSRDDSNNDKPACSHYDDMVYWLNRNDVRNAIHVPIRVQEYATCSRDVEAGYITEIDDVTPYVQRAIKSGIKILFFNGDVDSVCNVVHNLQFVSNLNQTLLQPAIPWNFDLNLPSTAGLYTAYEGVDFLTVLGGGHFPASSAQKPRQALQMFYNFINGSDYSLPIPKTSN